MASNSPTRVVTGTARLSYAHVWEPRASNGSKEERYGTAVLIPKSDTRTLTAINAAIDAAIAGNLEKFGGKMPNKATIKLPLRDGDAERPDDEAYRGMYFVNANSREAPQVVDQQLNPILNKLEVYSGCYARVSLDFYAFDNQGNRGVACGLGNIQKIADGEQLAGRSTAQDDFEGLPIDNPVAQPAFAPQQPAYAPPQPMQQPGYGYAPQPPAYGYAPQQPAPQPGYGYQQQPGFGAPVLDPITGQPMAAYGR